MFSNECQECAKTNKLIEEKEKKISYYQNNLYELKSKMMETSDMINVYFNYKNENEILRKENENLKKKMESGSQNNVSSNSKFIYENKYLKELEKNKTLEVNRSQLSAIIDELKLNQDFNLKTEITKLKKEISEKERFINSQNSIIEKLKGELHAKSRIDPIVNEKEKSCKLFDNEGNFELQKLNESNSKAKCDYITSNTENDYLKKQFRKYQIKYIKFKAKYKTLKSFTKYLIPTSSNQMMMLNNKKKRDESDDNKINIRNSISIIENNQINSGDKKSLSRKDSLSKSVELFENRNEYIFNEHEEDFNISNKNNQIINKQQSIDLIDEPSIKIKKRGRKSKKEEANKINKKDKVNKKKLSKKNLDSDQEMVPCIKELDNIENEEEITNAKLNNIVTTTQIHINPIRKEAPFNENNLKKEKEEYFENFIKIIESLNFKDLDSENSSICRVNEYIYNTDVNLTLHDKINNLIETILENSTKLELSNVLSFIKQFAIINKDTKLILNFKEYIISNHDIIINRQDILFKCESDNMVMKRNLNSIFKINCLENEESLVDLIKMNVNLQGLIAYILSIFYVNLTSGGFNKEINTFIFEILEVYDVVNSSNIFKIFRKLTKHIEIVNKENCYIHSYSQEIIIFKNNFNKIYFFNSLKSVIIKESIIKFIFGIIDHMSEEKEDTEFIIQNLIDRLNKLDSNIETKEINNDQINFAGELIYLEIYQMIFIISIYKDLEWIYKNIFEGVLWNKFLETKEESLKRVGIIFYISYIASIFVSRDLKCELEITKNIINWIYAIFDPKFNSQQISIYDRIAALSCFIDTHIIKFDQYAYTLIKQIINSISKNSLSVFPDDFLEKLKKLNFLA